MDMEYTHAWARALETSADSAPGSGSGDLKSPPPTECVRSSTTCASLIFSSSCGTTRDWAGWASASDCWATAGRVRAHHLGEEEKRHYLVYVLLEKHAGDLPDASRRIHRLQRAGAVGISVQSWRTRVACVRVKVDRRDAPGRGGGRASFPETSRGQPGPCRRATGGAVPAARREVEACLVPVHVIERFWPAGELRDWGSRLGLASRG